MTITYRAPAHAVCGCAGALLAGGGRMERAAMRICGRGGSQPKRLYAVTPALLPIAGASPA